MARYTVDEAGNFIPKTTSKPQEALLKEQMELAGLKIPKETTCGKVNLANLKETATKATKATLAIKEEGVSNE
jgi:hypothetical protein